MNSLRRHRARIAVAISFVLACVSVVRMTTYGIEPAILLIFALIFGFCYGVIWRDFDD